MISGSADLDADLWRNNSRDVGKCADHTRDLMCITKPIIKKLASFLFPHTNSVGTGELIVA